VHVGLLRAVFGESATSGVPTELAWQVRAPRAGACDAAGDDGDEGWSSVDLGDQRETSEWPASAQPTRRSWFVDADACALRLVVDRTNAGPPILRSVRVVETAVDVLRGAAASDDGSVPGRPASGAVDGTYEVHWAGAPGKGRWVWRVDLPAAESIDRIRIVLGFDGAARPRPGGGTSYGIARGPVRYSLETSEDGVKFSGAATEPHRADGSIVPLRRRLVTLAPRRTKAVRIVIEGATGADGSVDPASAPVIREVSAFRADDARPILASQWILSVNANPSAQMRGLPGGAWWNDVYHARFLQQRFARLLPGVRRDDRFAQLMGPHGEGHVVPPMDAEGLALESIEGDDPELDAELLARSSPPPIAVLSGSNDWDYAPYSRPDTVRPKRWEWDPLQDASAGGMGRLAEAVAGRVTPFVGFCGGAQILALLEASRAAPSRRVSGDQNLIDLVLKRTSGRPIRGFPVEADVEWAWPGERRPRRALVKFVPDDPLFADMAGPVGRAFTRGMPEAHADAIRADAFGPDGPLARFALLATSSFCGHNVVPARAADGITPDPRGDGWCDVISEAFRSREPSWPVIGTQFHPEQRDFALSAPGDPPQSVDDPRLFIAAALEQVVDAYERLGP
jgi:hypothetical protein